jgi:hypothetical protein
MKVTNFSSLLIIVGVATTTAAEQSSSSAVFDSQVSRLRGKLHSTPDHGFEQGNTKEIRFSEEGGTPIEVGFGICACF